MKLQILIPQYQETDEVIKPLLDSISVQQGINLSDYGVIIVNDGSGIYLSNEFLSSYPFKIEYYKEEHRGVSGTRNVCLDKATANYVMFCDADDMFYSVCALYIIEREMEQGFDSLVSLFIEETKHPITKEVLFVNHEMDSTFVHGKVHRRGYLIDKGIKFNPALTIHEDSYFNILTQNLSTNVKYCTTPLYLWKWRDESVCRHDPLYMLKTYRNMIYSNDALVDEFYRRGLDEKARFFCGFLVFDAYYTMNKPEWINQENKVYREETEREFSIYFAKHKEQWEALSAPEKMQISNGIRSRSINEGMQMETQTIESWLNWIQEIK